MNAPAPPPENQSAEIREDDQWGWTRKQRIGLGCLLFFLLASLTIQWWRRPTLLNDPVVIVHGETVTLPTRIDPNTASAAELSLIPHVGQKLASKIIDYRVARKPLTPDGIVFHVAEDLSRIAGLGGKTLELLRPYLQFPEDAETQPAGDHP